MAAGLTWRSPAAAAPAAVGLAGAAGACLVAAVAPDGTDPYPLCPFYAVTGWDCPGCGTLRAIHALTRGDLIGAADLNLLVVLLLPVALWGWVTWLRHTLRPDRRPAPAPRLPTWLGPAVLVALPLWWVGRNLPMFEVLASR